MLYAEHAEYLHAQMRCYTCTAVDDLVDTQVVIEGEGILALCRSCVNLMNEVLDIDPQRSDDEIETLTGLYTAAVENNDTLIRRERSLRGQLKSLKARVDTKVEEAEALKVQLAAALARNEEQAVAFNRKGVGTHGKRPPGYVPPVD